MLDLPENDWAVQSLRSALKWGRRPVEFLGGPTGPKWTDRDTLLAMALDEYESTRVGWGGYPKRLTQDKSQEGEFDVDSSTDFAKMAWDEWEAQERKRKGDAPAGRVTRVVWTGYRRPS